jgi:hypothetical protein
MYPHGRRVAGAQALYLLGTGTWPLLHRASFEWVTGKKQEFWLVRTVGGLAISTGLALGLSVLKGSRQSETVALALASGIVFGVADLRAARSESFIYLGDLVLQLCFAPAWLAPWDTESSES